MTQHPSSPADEDVLADCETADDVAELEAILGDAFNAPAVPPSLSQRLDDGITHRWGQSPELAPATARPVRRIASWSLRQMRSWRGATASIAAVLLVAIMLNASGGSAWAAVREALARQGLIEIREDDSIRWLDLSRSIAGRQTNDGAELVDLRKRVLLHRTASETTEQVLPSELTPSEDSLVLAFLLDEPLTTETFARLGSCEVRNQSSDPIASAGRELVRLNVRFATTASDDLNVHLDLDPESNLPVAVSDDEQAEVPVALVASLRSVDEWTADLFPTPPTLIADNGDGSPTPRDSLAGTTDSSMMPPEGDQVAQLPGVVVPTIEATTSSLPVGAAKQWQPVAVQSQPDGNVLDAVNVQLGRLWDREGVVPVDRASDTELLRRAYLDLAGRTPTVREVRDYLGDIADDRYERLVDRLLESPDYASQMAAVWRSFLIPEGVDLDAFGGRSAFEEWLAKRFGSGEPYDQIVRKLLLAEGRLATSGPLLFYSALKLDADQLAARTSRAFLGIRLECAQCHDHPFEPWTQSDFWSYAAFFAQISRPRGMLENASTVMQVRDVNRGEVMMPDTDVAVAPKFLGSDKAIEASLGKSDKTTDQSRPSEDARRKQLADWLTSAENPYFARATVNRLWAYFFGRGIVDPVDDFGVSNPPVSPELLDLLASQLIDSNYDLRRTVRTIVLSDAYRLASSSGDATETETKAAERLDVFAQMNVKTLTAEQLYDCISVATLLDASGGSTDFSMVRFGNSQRDQFLQTFAAPSSSRSQFLAGIPQALTLMNGGLINGATGESSSGMIRSLQAPFFSDPQRIDVLFMATLSRPATTDEQKLLADLIPADATDEQRYAALSDILWALINSSEFTLNH